MSEHKLCLFLRLAFLESITRYELLFKHKLLKPTRVYVFAERVTLYPNNSSAPKGGGTTSYGWFVWDKKAKAKSTKIKWIKPGFKKQFS